MPEAVVEQPASSTALLLDYAGVFRFQDSEWDVRLQRGLFSVRSAVIVYSYSFPISFLFICGLHYSLWFEFIRSLFGRPSTTARHLCYQSRPWWTRPMKRQAETSQKYKKLIRIQNNYLRTWQMLKVCILEDTFSYVAHLIVATTWLFSGHWTDDKKWNVRDIKRLSCLWRFIVFHSSSYFAVESLPSEYQRTLRWSLPYIWVIYEKYLTYH